MPDAILFIGKQLNFHTKKGRNRFQALEPGTFAQWTCQYYKLHSYSVLILWVKEFNVIFRSWRKFLAILSNEIICYFLSLSLSCSLDKRRAFRDVKCSPIKLNKSRNSTKIDKYLLSIWGIPFHQQKRQQHNKKNNKTRNKILHNTSHIRYHLCESTGKRWKTMIAFAIN